MVAKLLQTKKYDMSLSVIVVHTHSRRLYMKAVKDKLLAITLLTHFYLPAMLLNTWGVLFRIVWTILE